jgi:hypothetical protein
MSKNKFKLFRIFKNKMQIQPDVMEKYLSRYDEYLDWVDRHFNVNSYFEYERDLPNIEKFILNLNVFKGWNSRPLSWEDKFDIDWNSWNRMHYLLSLVPFDHEFSDEEKEFMKTNIDTYSQARMFIQDLQDTGIVISGIPIKLHTLHEKAELISNIDQCLLNYNKWVSVAQPTYAIAYHPETLTQAAQLEYAAWTSPETASKSLLTYNDIPKKQLELSDLKWVDD